MFLTPRNIFYLGVPLIVIATGAIAFSLAQEMPASIQAPLPTGRTITPPSEDTAVGSFPANMVTSPDGKWVVVTNTGSRQNLSVISTVDGHLTSQLSYDKPLVGLGDKKTSLYYGLAFSPVKDSSNSSVLFVSRGPEDKIEKIIVDVEGQLHATGQWIVNPSSIAKDAKGVRENFVAGIALNSSGKILYAANNETSILTHFHGSVSILDTVTNKLLARVETPGFPFAISAVTKGANADRKLYVSSEQDGVVSVIDTREPTRAHLVRNIQTGSQPISLLLDSKQQRLFVANAGSDTVSVIDTRTDRVTATILLRPEDARSLPGTTPTSLALSPDESKLYVTLADLNAIAVVRLEPKLGVVEGYIPTGWYPTSLCNCPDGSLMAANAKGAHTRNPNGKKAGPDGAWGQYILDIIEGSVSRITLPDPIHLKQMTAQVLRNANITPQMNQANRHALPDTGIKHVIYIIKENRTYDQVLGDITAGNGDPALTIFGKNVTPNQHALADRFVLLDNFYCCAEVSADGWDWSTSGMISEYTARNTPFNYSGRGRSYDFEGETNGIPTDMIGIPDVARAPSGYLWDNCLAHGVSFRNYGFYNAFDDSKDEDGAVIAAANEPTKRALRGRTDGDFLRFAMDYADSEAWTITHSPSPKLRKEYGSHRAPSRFSEWKHEFDHYVLRHNLPALMMVRFPRDHTSGTKEGLESPRAMVADNDYAVGQLVEAVSKSPYWKETAIFILEDDAQDGFDHVDAHRSPCYVISSTIKRTTVDHHFYNTDSVLRTMEVLLGLPPMSQYDASAPLFSSFRSKSDNSEPYVAILPSREILTEVNSKSAYKSRESSKLNFHAADINPAGIMNDILWHSVKGAMVPLPMAAKAHIPVLTRNPN